MKAQSKEEFIQIQCWSKKKLLYATFSFAEVQLTLTNFQHILLRVLGYGEALLRL